MRERLPVILSLAGAAVMFGSIVLVGVLVTLGIAFDGVNFPGEPEIADAAAYSAQLDVR